MVRDALREGRGDRDRGRVAAREDGTARGHPLPERHREGEAVQVDRHRRERDRRRQRDRERRRRVLERRRVEDEQRRGAADVDRVVAGAAVDDRFERRTRAQDPDLVRPAGAVDLDALHVRERDDPARARDVLVGDDEAVADRRADHDDRVDAGAAVDLDRAVLDVLVAVRALAAEERGQVRDVVRIVRVLLQREERLQEEAVVAVAAVRVDLRSVVVDLEGVVLVLAQDEERRRVPVRHVVDVGDGHAVGELERAVAGIGDQRNGADDDVVVAAAGFDHRRHRRVVREDLVGAAERVDRDPLHLLVLDAGGRDVARAHRADPERAASGRVQVQVVGLIRAEDVELVHARAAARIDDVDLRRVADVDRHDVVLRSAVRPPISHCSSPNTA